MAHSKAARPVRSLVNLKGRIYRLLRKPNRRAYKIAQIPLDLPKVFNVDEAAWCPGSSIAEFLDFICNALPEGDVYLFGGVLRDVALLGGKEFSSDIDVVVDGDWRCCALYFESLGAYRNKFGGYRLEVAGWLVDIWSAKETWAVKQGLVKYRGIPSLLETTVLNWDAILMSWKSGRFICSDNYLCMLENRVLDIVLEKNPNPLGMVTRVFRHFCLKDARKITPKAAEFLARSANKYSFNEIKKSELRSYGDSVIESAVYEFFECFGEGHGLGVEARFKLAEDAVRKRNVALSCTQFEWKFEDMIAE